jgi:hypothetical protein
VEPRAAPATEGLVDQSVGGGQVTLRVPTSWRRLDTAEGVQLDALDGNSGIISASDSASDFTPTFMLGEYLERVKTSYGTPMHASFGNVESRRVGGVPGLRTSFSGTSKVGTVLNGFVYVAKGRARFFHFIVLFRPSHAELDGPVVAGYVENGSIEGEH